MAMLWTPASEPVIQESWGTPEFYADGGAIIDRGEIMTVVYFVERTSGGIVQNHEVARIHYARHRWMTGLSRIAARFGAGSGMH